MVKGVLAVLGASLIFGVLPTANKFIILQGVAADNLTFYSQLLIFCFSFLAAQVCKVNLKIKWSNRLQLMLLGAIGMGLTMALLNQSYQSLSVGLAVVLHFLYPTIVSAVMIFLFGHKLTGLKVLAMFGSVLGMILIMGIGQETNIEGIGMILALLSSITYAIYIIANEKSAAAKLPIIGKIVYMSFGSMLLFGLISLGRGSMTMPSDAKTWLLLLFFSGFGSFLAHLLIVHGISKIGASSAAFINMAEPVMGLMAGVLIYGDVFTVKTGCGMLLIMAAMFFVTIDNKAHVEEVEDCKQVNCSV